MSDKLEKVNSLLQKEIAQIILKEVSMPDIGMVSINWVETAADLKTAKVWVSFLNNTKGLSLRKLQKFAPKVQYFLGKRIKLKFIPKLNFLFDTSGEYVSHIEELFKQVHDREHPS